ncbi:hypothetical protein RsTz2092_12830 [Deferribacterales bacterium RsTz2092]|nr:hypothetical protein AGMMS49941_12550 [Deferribacterales bacterium]
MADNTKSIKLRAFNIKSTDMIVNASEILTQLKTKLPNTKAKDRQKVLNSEDPTGEHDVMSDFTIQENIFSGTILRIIPNGDDEHIEANLFEKETFSIDEIKRTKAGGAAIYKSHTHICLDDANIITDLRYPNTIQGVETYINSLLDTHIFKFNPIVIPKPNMSLVDISTMTFSDSSNQSSINTTERKSFWIDKTMIKSIMDKVLSDTQTLADIDIEQLISAKLQLKFVKPKSMSEDDYKRKLSAMLKPISDLDNVSFESKDKRKLSAKDLLREKLVSIEKTDTGFISEQQLNIEMAIFLDEIKNEENHS